MWKCITIMSTLTTSDDKMEGLKKKGKIQKKKTLLRNQGKNTMFQCEM